MKIGDELGNFVIDGELGSGSFGVVFRGHNKTSTEMRRAFKVMRLDPRDDPEVARLFLREAAVLQRVDSPHVCRIYDVGYTDDQRPYLSMELLEGETLSQTLARGQLPIDVALDYLLQVCDGLAALHRRDFVHRDLKPANIFVTTCGDRPMIKLLDFNIAKGSRPAVGTTLSSPEWGPGTDHYMSPEQIVDPDTVDESTDVWAAGAVLFEMVAGYPPFKGATSGAIKVAIVNGDRHPVPDHASSVGPLIDRCLAPRAQRFRDVSELRGALVAARRSPDVALAVAAGTAPRSGGTAGVATEPTVDDRARARAAVRARDFFARNWTYFSLTLFFVGLLLLLGSFAAHPELNEFTDGSKRIGYASSFNWTIVHTFLCPVAVAFLGVFLNAANDAAATLGSHMSRDWDRRAPRIAWTWIVMSALFAAGYTVVEWRGVFTGDCELRTYLGWPNKLCSAHGHELASTVFMVVAAIAQSVVISVSFLWFAVVLWFCEVVFGRGAARIREPRAVTALGELFGIALWGWIALLISLFLARLWSFHLQSSTTGGIVSTILSGLPVSLFEINAHSQPDMASMVNGGVIAAAAIVPFLLLRARSGSTNATVALTPPQKTACAFGVIGWIAMFFPRLGILTLVAIAIAMLAVPPLRRSLPRAWRRRQS